MKPETCGIAAPVIVPPASGERRGYAVRGQASGVDPTPRWLPPARAVVFGPYHAQRQEAPQDS
eukprot:3867196-Prymnesium_polylepis.1